MNTLLKQVQDGHTVQEWISLSRDEQDAAIIWFDNTDDKEVESFCVRKGVNLREGKPLMRGWQILAMTVWVIHNRQYTR